MLPTNKLGLFFLDRPAPPFLGTLSTAKRMAPGVLGLGTIVAVMAMEQEASQYRPHSSFRPPGVLRKVHGSVGSGQLPIGRASYSS